MSENFAREANERAELRDAYARIKVLERQVESAERVKAEAIDAARFFMGTAVFDEDEIRQRWPWLKLDSPAQEGE